MARFTVRMVLHDADWEDYATLHEKMKANGFADKIKSDDGTWYEMPPAEYDYRGACSLEDVMSKAKASALSTRKKYAVFITESAGRKWRGLDEV